MLLSMVVATRNNAPWLGQCLDSILEQTVREMEIVVVDDGSADESPAMLRDYMRRFPDRVRGIMLPERVGVARARDRGFREARGKYVSTLDGDDYLLRTDKLERELDLVLREGRRGHAVAAFSGVRRVDARGNPLPADPAPLREGRITAELLARSCRIPRDFTFRREFYFQAGGYDFRFPIYEDWDFKLRLSTLVEYRFAGSEGMAYRRHGGGLSAAPARLHRRWMKRVFVRNRCRVTPPERRAAARALKTHWDSLRRRHLHEYLQGGRGAVTAWADMAVLRFRGESTPGWRALLRRLPGASAREEDVR